MVSPLVAKGPKVGDLLLDPSGGLGQSQVVAPALRGTSRGNGAHRELAATEGRSEQEDPWSGPLHFERAGGLHKQGLGFRGLGFRV